MPEVWFGWGGRDSPGINLELSLCELLGKDRMCRWSLLGIFLHRVVSAMLWVRFPAERLQPLSMHSPGVGPQPVHGHGPSERSHALDAPLGPSWVRPGASWLWGFMVLLGHGSWSSWGSRGPLRCDHQGHASPFPAELVGTAMVGSLGLHVKGWWGASEAATPSVCFSPLEAADEQSIFPSLALAEQRGLGFAGLRSRPEPFLLIHPGDSSARVQGHICSPARPTMDLPSSLGLN